MKNLIDNIVKGQSDGKNTGYKLARKTADDNETETGNKTIVTRILDYTDIFNGKDRYHFSFDVVELKKK